MGRQHERSLVLAVSATAAERAVLRARARAVRLQRAPSVDEAELRRLAHRMGAPRRADELVASSMKGARYDPVMKLGQARPDYDAHRMTYRGDGGWSWPLRSGPLPQLVRAVVPVIGTDAFFELISRSRGMVDDG